MSQSVNWNSVIQLVNSKIEILFFFLKFDRFGKFKLVMGNWIWPSNCMYFDQISMMFLYKEPGKLKKIPRFARKNTDTCPTVAWVSIYQDLIKGNYKEISNCRLRFQCLMHGKLKLMLPPGTVSVFSRAKRGFFQFTAFLGHGKLKLMSARKNETRTRAPG